MVVQFNETVEDFKHEVNQNVLWKRLSGFLLMMQHLF